MAEFVSAAHGPAPARRPTGLAGPLDHVSSSLRQAYQSTLDETVPDALMDLLRRLD